ncbi:MAG TPA: glycosyltransferase family 2 protein [Blastocatellia bacterium]|nr:glycosyltransferase family 2 protein [Blastocatellia bacterium]
MPCLNEAETLATCIRKAQLSMLELNLNGEVVIADNGSTDGSQTIAQDMGARVVAVEAKGYGNALMGGIQAARGKYIIMGDADDSYDFVNLGPFVEKLRAGYDLVMGNRFLGGIKPGAMPPLHKYLGNPVLTGIGRVLFRSPCGDFHCGLRGFSKEAITRLDLRTTGMEFASEMVVKATIHNLPITEVPTTLSPDGRSRPPHLRSWRDGWRHLRFLMLYSPRWLFLYHGLALMLLGLVTGLCLLPGPLQLGGVTFDVHSLLYSSLAIVIGFQTVCFAVFTKVFAISEGLLPEDARLNNMLRYINLEVGLVTGAALLLAGVSGTIYAFVIWDSLSYGPLQPSNTLRVVIPAITAIVLGCQVILASFFLSILGLRRQ